MWMFTKIGFFSVVADRQDPAGVIVRGRYRRHLEDLKKRFPELLQPNVLQTTKCANYPYRILMPTTIWAKIARDLAQEIDYPNFKEMADAKRDRLGSAYVQALHDIWLVLLEAVRN